MNNINMKKIVAVSILTLFGSLSLTKAANANNITGDGCIAPNNMSDAQQSLTFSISGTGKILHGLQEGGATIQHPITLGHDYSSYLEGACGGLYHIDLLVEIGATSSNEDAVEATTNIAGYGIGTPEAGANKNFTIDNADNISTDLTIAIKLAEADSKPKSFSYSIPVTVTASLFETTLTIDPTATQ